VGARARRIAENESLYRDANERIAARAEEAGPAARIPFICECFARTCEERLLLTIDEYDRAHANPAQFVVARGHVDGCADIEVVVEEHADYVIVRKRGEAGEIARREAST
jgi:hypothetical protein